MKFGIEQNGFASFSQLRKTIAKEIAIPATMLHIATRVEPEIILTSAGGSVNALLEGNMWLLIDMDLSALKKWWKKR